MKTASLICWELVESYRTERGPRQRVVSHLGDVDDPAMREELLHVAEGHVPIQESLCDAPMPEWVEINERKVWVERPRRFGDVWIALELIKKLGLGELFDRVMPDVHPVPQCRPQGERAGDASRRAGCMTGSSNIWRRAWSASSEAAPPELTDAELRAMLGKFGNVLAATIGLDKKTDVLEECGFATMPSSLPLPTSFNLRRFRAYHLRLEAVDPMDNGTASSEVMWIPPLPIR